MAEAKVINLPELLKKGQIGVLLTDTLYGLVGDALNKKAVKRIYKVRLRNPKKPFIVLIHSLTDLPKLGIKLTGYQKKLILKLWPGPVSIILPCNNKNLHYLHRGTNTLALRFPKNKKLISLIKKTGPLVAPSANKEGQEPATTIAKAKKYFGKKVDFYIEGKKISNLPSTLIKFNKNKIEILRQGAGKIPL